MINLYYIEEQGYLSVIKHCFSKDVELCEKWHILSPCDPGTCAEKTYEDLQETGLLKFFTIYGDREIIGFFGVEIIEKTVLLKSFFIVPKYRNKEVIIFFWDAVYEQAGESYYAGIYEKNERAKNFLERNGFTVINAIETKEQQKGLIFKSN